MVWMLAHKTIQLIIAAERQRGSTLFLAFHSIQSFARNYVKSNLDLVSVTPSDCRNSGEQYIRRLFWGWGGGGDQTIFLIACACFRLLISMWSSFIQYHASLQVIYCKRIIKKRTFFFRMDMALFLSADFHQGNEIFNVHSRGKQCAFMALSVLLTARNILLSSWSKVTFNNVKETNCT